MQSLFDAIYGVLVSLLYWQVQAIGWFMDLLWDNIFGPAAHALADWAWSMLPASLVDWLNQRPWEALYSIGYDIDWFTGCYSCIAVLGVGITIAAGIRFVRWVLACIPMLNL